MELISLREILSLAQHIEDNAARYYRRVAEAYSGRPGVEVFERLAELEDGHRSTFERMRDTAPAEPRAQSLHPEGGMYMAAIAAGYRVEGSPYFDETITGEVRIEEVLRRAIELEKQAILFYLGLVDVLSDASSKSIVQQIIAQEKGHLVALSQELEASTSRR